MEDLEKNSLSSSAKAFDALLKKRKIRNGQAAEKLGVSQVTIGYLRKGKRKPSPYLAKTIAEIYKIPALGWWPRKHQ